MSPPVDGGGGGENGSSYRAGAVLGGGGVRYKSLCVSGAVGCSVVGSMGCSISAAGTHSLSLFLVLAGLHVVLGRKRSLAGHLESRQLCPVLWQLRHLK